MRNEDDRLLEFIRELRRFFTQEFGFDELNGATGIDGDGIESLDSNDFYLS